MKANYRISHCILSLFILVGLTSCGSSSNQHLSRPISTVAPVNNSTNISLNTNITASFSEAMLPGSFTDSSFTLKSSHGDIIPATVHYNARTNEVLLNPRTNLALSSTYTATLTSDIKDLKGKPLTQTSWQFTTRDGTWQTSLDISNGYAPNIVFDENDNAFLVWSESDETSSSFLVKRYFQSTGWEKTEKVISHQALKTASHSISFASNGNALAVWVQQVWSQLHGTYVFGLFSNYYTVGTGWGTVEKIGTEGDSFNLPKVAFDKNGNALAIWVSSGSSYGSIFSNSYTIGSGWGISERISRDSSPFNPSIAYDSKGNALVLWMGDFGKIWSRYYVASTGWGIPVVVENTEGWVGPAQIIFDSSNNTFIAMWSGNNYKAIISKRYHLETGWGSKQVIASINLGTIDSPHFALNTTGDIFVAWRQWLGKPSGIWTRHYTVDTGWESVNKIASFDEGRSTSSYPNIVLDKNGNALIAWRQNDENIWSSRYNKGIGWSTATAVGKTNSKGSSPRLTINSKGNAFMTWVNGLNQSIKVNYFK